MNRTERRAARKRRGRVTPGGSSSPENPPDIDYRLAAAKRLQQTGELITARDICRDILAHHPRHVQTLIVLAGILQQGGRNNQAVKVLREAMALGGESATSHDTLAMAYQGLGRRKDAILHFKQAISAGLGDVETLIKESPAVAGCLRRLNGRWPRRMPLQELFGDAGITAIANDALLVALLHMRPVCDIELERLLTAMRHAWLQTAFDGDIQSKADEEIEFFCALTQQCFINEYVYGLSDGEIEEARKLRDRLVQALQSGAAVEPSLLIVVAAYFPLHTLHGSMSLLNHSWPDAISSLVRQQVREPLDEIEDRKSIVALTAVTNAVSLQVKQQYEENPYPRWTFAKVPAAMTIADYLRSKLPYAQVHRSRMPSDFDVLIAGCGTGAHSIQTAQRFPQARVLAIDISLPSLAYARRKSRDAGLYRIEYAQADILELGSMGRRFDVIESVGVLHHLSDPASGLKVLTSLLRPDGLMLIGLYSAAARRPENAARAYLAEQGYQPTTDDIRAGRQDLIQRGNALRTVDFFTISGCRDLMFNVMERQFTIPAIKTLLAANGLKFIGFEVSPGVIEQFRQMFSDPAASADLECWREFEEKQPWTFAEMYVFWVERTPNVAAIL